MVRADEEQLASLWANGKLLILDRRGRVAVLPNATALSFGTPTGRAVDRATDAVLLGVADGVGLWAVQADDVDSTGDWQDLRTIGALLNDTDAGLFTTAVGLLGWHRHAKFCARCGAVTKPAKAGWARLCTGCGREEYPRIDPAVICLVHDEADHVVLARQPVWPSQQYSILAGFVEIGESLEACVVREVAEEVGLAVRDVRYLGSQPWPLPRSLMIGFAAITDPGAPLYPAAGEIEDARWVHRDEVRAALDAGGSILGLILPGETSIARKMLAGWAGG